MMARKKAAPKEKRPTCFVIMPLRSIEGRDPNHFGHVYKYLFEPACERAGFHGISPAHESETHLIHEKIIRRLTDSDIVLCDISTHNPNVLFELGMRQAFDKPVTIVRERGTEGIFDISGLLYTDYGRSLSPWELEQDVPKIANALEKTWSAAKEGQTTNSLMGLLKLSRAPVPEFEEAKTSPAFQVLLREMQDIRRELNFLSRVTDGPKVTDYRFQFDERTQLGRAAIQVRSRLEKMGVSITVADKEIRELVISAPNKNIALRALQSCMRRSDEGLLIYLGLAEPESEFP
jgi:hypothetical protein